MSNLSLTALVQGLKPSLLKAAGLDHDALHLTMFGGFKDATRVIVEPGHDPKLVAVEWRHDGDSHHAEFPVVCLHGFLKDLFAYRSLAPALERNQARVFSLG